MEIAYLFEALQKPAVARNGNYDQLHNGRCYRAALSS